MIIYVVEYLQNEVITSYWPFSSIEKAEDFVLSRFGKLRSFNCRIRIVDVDNTSACAFKYYPYEEK